MASLSSWKNFWLNIKATPLISSTLASAVVFRLIKFAVMAMASLPRNSFRRKPGGKKFFRGGYSWLERKTDHFKQEGVLMTTLGNVGVRNQWENFRASLLYPKIRCLPNKVYNNPGKKSKSPTY